jgi:trehalose utilization protein
MCAVRVTVWNEYRHEREKESIAKIYPNGIHNAIAEGLSEAGYSVRTATLDEPEHGLTEEVLAETDVLTWWGHKAHGDVSDAIVERVHARVLEGMGLIVLHSGHFSKIFRKLMGTSCSLRWREADERERLWVVNYGHPITAGLDPYFEIPEAEMYGELFDVPQPDALVFVSWFEGGNVFRSGLCYHRGRGKVFYFRPGHETYPIYYMPNVRKVLANAVAWAAPAPTPAYPYPGNRAINEKESLETIPDKHPERQRVG